MSNRATSARYTDIVTSTLKTIGGFSTDVDGQSDLEITGGAKFGNNIEVIGNITGSVVGPVTGDVTGNVMTNFISAATGTLTTVSDDALFNGDITINSLTQDDTETKLVSWNSIDKSVEYVERDNMFGQALSATSPVEHLSLSLNNDNTIISSVNDSLTAVAQTPAVTTGLKDFIFQSETDDTSTRLLIQNRSANATAHSSLLLQTDADVCSGNGGNQCILYDSCSVGGWIVGRQRTTNTFRWNYDAIGPEYLTNDANTKMYLASNGDLHLGRFLYLNDNATTFQANGDSDAIVGQAPASTAGPKSFRFVSESTDSAVVMRVQNQANSLTGHSSIYLLRDAVLCNGNAGNGTILFERCGFSKWEIGHQSSTDTFRFNYGAGYDYLTNDAYTKMFLDTSGNLEIDGEMRIGNNNVIISTANDSITGFNQTPAVTTGQKEFVFTSASTDKPVLLSVRNFATGPNAHTGVSVFNSPGGGNMFTKYFELGCCVWLSGFQTSTETFRWNYDAVGDDNLNIDANTKMSLSNTGDLTTNNLVLNGPAADPAYISMQSDNGTVWYLFIEDDGTLKVHSGVPTANTDGVVVGSQT